MADATPTMPSSILHPQPNEPLLRTVVCKLHIEIKLARLEQLDHFLQRVAILAADPNKVAVDGSLNFELRILDDLHNFLGFLRGNSLLQIHFLAHSAVG